MMARSYDKGAFFAPIALLAGCAFSTGTQGTTDGDKYRKWARLSCK